MPLVKCKGCGWLGVRVKLTRTLVDADEAYRDNGYVGSHTVGSHTPEQICDTLPVCFANKRNFYEECRTPIPSQDVIKGMLNLDYECNSLTPWQPGMAPRDLMDMKMLEEQRAWQAAESKKADDRHEQSLKVAIDAGKSNWVSQAAVGILGAIVALLAVWVGARLNKPPQIFVQPAPVITQPVPATPDATTNKDPTNSADNAEPVFP